MPVLKVYDEDLAAFVEVGGGSSSSSIYQTSGISLSQNSSVTITDATVILDVSELLVASTPSYSNSGGTGNRTSIISAWAFGSPTFFRVGSPDQMVDGSFSNNAINSGDALNRGLGFDFGSNRVITEVRFRSSGGGFGNWVIQGSTDGTNWSSDLCVPVTITDGSLFNLSANITAYRYYRMIGVSGYMVDSNYFWEVEFKISTGDSITPTYKTLIPGSEYSIVRNNADGETSHVIQRLKAGTADHIISCI